MTVLAVGHFLGLGFTLVQCGWSRVKPVNSYTWHTWYVIDLAQSYVISCECLVCHVFECLVCREFECLVFECLVCRVFECLVFKCLVCRVLSVFWVLMSDLSWVWVFGLSWVWMSGLSWVWVSDLLCLSVLSCLVCHEFELNVWSVIVLWWNV